MKVSMRKLTDKALEAVRTVMSDTSGPKSDNVEALEEIEAECQALLSALEEDGAANKLCKNCGGKGWVYDSSDGGTSPCSMCD